MQLQSRTAQYSAASNQYATRERFFPFLLSFFFVVVAELFTYVFPSFLFVLFFFYVLTHSDGQKQLFVGAIKIF